MAPGSRPHESPARTDHLYLVITAGKPLGGARWALDGIERVEVGRGQKSTRTAQRTGSTLRIDVPDPWMSTSHLLFVREGGAWAAVDAGSRNGILINNMKLAHKVLEERDVVEAGRSFFSVHYDEAAADPILDLGRTDASGIVTLDPSLAEKFRDLVDAARREAPILIRGPHGSGKDRLARTAHDRSRRSGDFVPVDCAHLPPGSIESELYGHVGGAYPQPGLVLMSSGGTLFLDGVGDLPAPVRIALLRVLDHRAVLPVGGTVPVGVDLNFVATTHRKLVDGFPEHITGRLGGFQLVVPPLAERIVDLGLLLGEIVPPATQLAGVTARVLLAYHWPNNLRELASVLDRAVTRAQRNEIALAYLPEAVANARFETSDQ